MTVQLSYRYMRARAASREHAKSTQRTVRYVLAEFVGQVPGDPLLIKPRHILRWLESQSGVNSTVATKYGAVRAFTGWACATGEIPKDPCLGIAGPKRPRRVPRAFDPTDVDLLLNQAPTRRLRAAMSLMACEGLRISEVCTVQIGDIDRRNGIVRVIGKGDKERLVHLTPATAAAIDAYLFESPVASGTLIRSLHDARSPITTTQLGRLISAYMVEVGVKAFPRDGRSPHAFRHSYGSDMISGGATLPEVADLMGHEAIQTTMLYQRRVDMERTRSVAEGRSYAHILRPVQTAGLTAIG